MLIAYIAGPYRANTEWGVEQNIAKAEAVALKYWKLGYAVICPHKNTAHFGGAMPDETWLEGDIEIMKRCDVVVMSQGWEDSVGSVVEHRIAINLGIKIIYDFDWL